MNETNTYPNLHLAAARLLDAIEARPRDRAEFNAAKTRALQSVHVEPARKAHRGWLRLAARLGRALGARRRDPALQLAADFLDLPRLCTRSACHKAQSCRGEARACLKQFAPRVPESVRAAMAAFCERIERGDSLELAVALLPFECKAALWAWWQATEDKSVILRCERSEPRRMDGLIIADGSSFEARR
jgi:hypothetical protein